MKVRYHFFGGPNDGLRAYLPTVVEEISLPVEEMPEIDDICEMNRRCHGHPYSHYCVFHLYVCKDGEMSDGYYIMRHDGIINMVTDEHERCNED